MYSSPFYFMTSGFWVNYKGLSYSKIIKEFYYSSGNFMVFFCVFKFWSHWCLSWGTMWNTGRASIFSHLAEHHLLKSLPLTHWFNTYHIPNSHINLGLFLGFIWFLWPVYLCSIIFWHLHNISGYAYSIIYLTILFLLNI